MNNYIPLELLTYVESVLQDHQLYHSDFQMDSFITSNSGDHHPWGMYRQVLRELHNRKTIVIDSEHNLKELEITIEERLLKLRKWGWGRKHKLSKQRQILELEKIRRSKITMVAQLEDVIREIKRFSEQARLLRQELGPLDDEKRKTLEEGYWLHRLKLQVTTGLLSKRCVPHSIFEMLPGLPESVRKPLLQHINDPDNRNYLTHLKPPQLKALKSA